MENSKMLPPSKRFKMENSVSVHQNGLKAPPPAGGSRLSPSSADSASSSSGSASTQVPPPATHTKVSPGEDLEEEPLPACQDQVMSTSDITSQMTDLENARGSSPERSPHTKTPGPTQSPGPTQTPGPTQIPGSSSVQALTSPELQQKDPFRSTSSTTDPCEAKELHEGQEIYIQTEGLTVHLAEPRSDGIVIVNGPDGTTMHIQTPEGVPLEAVQALLGIESSDGEKALQ